MECNRDKRIEKFYGVTWFPVTKKLQSEIKWERFFLENKCNVRWQTDLEKIGRPYLWIKIALWLSNKQTKHADEASVI